MNNKYKTSLSLVMDEIKIAEEKWPIWPENKYEGIAIITEELGELSQAILRHEKENGAAYEILLEAVQVACTSIRFIYNFLERCQEK